MASQCENIAFAVYIPLPVLQKLCVAETGMAFLARSNKFTNVICAESLFLVIWLSTPNLRRREIGEKL
jgi:hypothetical protein